MRRAASRAASATTSFGSAFRRGSVRRPIRSLPGSAPTSSMYGRVGGGATYGSPGAGPCTASRIAAVSRTDFETTSSTVRPDMLSPMSGPSEVRCRVVFSPTRPHSLAGIRIDPPPSFACATGTIPEATAAADPPLEPPVRDVAGRRRAALVVELVDDRVELPVRRLDPLDRRVDQLLWARLASPNEVSLSGGVQPGEFLAHRDDCISRGGSMALRVSGSRIRAGSIAASLALAYSTAGNPRRSRRFRVAT